MSSPFTPVVFYKDPIAALQWLERAFGFETTILVTNEAGSVGHAEMQMGDGAVGVGEEWASPELIGPASLKSPASMNGAGSQFVAVRLDDGLDAHCERARAAGARITQAPADQAYGDRNYRALDLEGHVWVFSQPIADPAAAQVSEDDASRLAGYEVRDHRQLLDR